ncbi:MAG TPA: hypothetical protein VGK78_07815 [Nocardioides sp.]|uniref:hypothetical protein n=1 Tax=Nocardioides sp. TaxID=35761 RepID=UPI002F3E98E5
MSMFSNPGSAPFRDLPPGPHPGVPTDPDAHVAPDSLDRRIRSVVRSRWTLIVLGCVVVAIFVVLSLY